MFHRCRCVWVWVLLLGVSTVVFAGDSDGRIVSETSLRKTPDAGDLSGLLTTGAPVQVLEQRGEWTKVRLEGWIRSSAVEIDRTRPAVVETRPASARGVAEPAARPVTTGGFPVEGLVSIKMGEKKKKTLSTAGTSLWLVPPGVDLRQRDTETESDRRLAEIDAEVERLEQEAGDALKRIDNFTEATRRRDELKRERAAALRERRDLLAVRNGRHEQVAREHALQTSLVDTRGWFTLSAVPPGTYTLYGRLTQEGIDVEWIEKVTVGEAALRVDLDETTAQGL